MNTNAIKETATLIANIEPLLFTEIKQAEHHGNDTIRISTARAREIHRMAIALEKRLKNILVTEATAAETTTDRHLNKIFGIN
jgi:wyosine [tRNA(Phe)-imidazoG37] synthetase (radical SAM superfamily)